MLLSYVSLSHSFWAHIVDSIAHHHLYFNVDIKSGRVTVIVIFFYHKMHDSNQSGHMTAVPGKQLTFDTALM